MLLQNSIFVVHSLMILSLNSCTILLEVVGRFNLKPRSFGPYIVIGIFFNFCNKKITNLIHIDIVSSYLLFPHVCKGCVSIFSNGSYKIIGGDVYTPQNI